MCCTGWCLSACVYLLSLREHWCPDKLPFLSQLRVQWSLLLQQCTGPHILLSEQAELLPCACWLRNLGRKQQVLWTDLFWPSTPIFFLNKTLGVFAVTIFKLPGEDRLLLLKVWLFCTLSGVPVLPMCTCESEHRDGIASSIVLQKPGSHSRVQTALQNWALSSPLWLC